MRKHAGIILAVAALAAAAGSFAGCASLHSAPNGGNATLTIYSENNGNRAFRLAGAYPSSAALTGTATGNDNSGYTLTVTELEWFSNWVDGWTEAKFLASGSISVAGTGANDKPQRDRARALSPVAPIAIESPSWAKIRYRDTIIDPDTATGQLANRWDRVVAITIFLAEKNITYSGTGKDALRDFETNARKILFPELYGYPEGSTKGAGKESALAEGVSWDTAYTLAAFPEELRAIRDSGTILRDWEEGFELFLLASRQNAVTDGMPVRIIVKKAAK
jgi:hypothetical protein